MRAERGAASPPGVRTGLLVTGQFVSVDQGNRTERVAIGLGAGRSDVRVRAQVFDVSPAGRKLVDEIEVDAKSGLAPGMAETMGVRRARRPSRRFDPGQRRRAGRRRVAGRHGDGQSDRAAKGIAKQLASFFGQQGWTDCGRAYRERVRPGVSDTTDGERRC